MNTIQGHIGSIPLVALGTGDYALYPLFFVLVCYLAHRYLAHQKSGIQAQAHVRQWEVELAAFEAVGVTDLYRVRYKRSIVASCDRIVFNSPQARGRKASHH